MKTERPKLKLEDLIKLFESYDQNEINSVIMRFVHDSIQGKKFFNRETIIKMKDFVEPFFLKIEEIKQPIPLSQYQDFISTIAKAQPDLFQEEREKTQQKIFSIMEHPMKFVKYLYPMYSDNLNYIRCAQKSKEILDITSSLDDSEISEEKLVELLDFIKKVADSLQKRNMVGTCNYLKAFINKQNCYSEEKKDIINEKLDELVQIIEEQALRRKEIINNPTEFGRNILRAVIYTRSHIEYFLSHIHRLVHIKNKGNKDYGGKYYQYGSNMFSVRNFINMCEEELKDFEALQSFLIDYSKKLKELRNINAHQVVGEIKLSADHKFLLIPEIGKKDNQKINHKELCDTIISYGIFINKIELHPKSPYDTSEDTFGILKF